MTQPAKANEPSMEEILASIRRIIADDDATKSEHSGLEPQKPAVSASPAVAAASVKAPPQQSPIDAAAAAGTVNDIRADEESAEILELTESMAAPMPIRPVAMPAPQPASAPPSSFRTIEAAERDVEFTEVLEKAGPPEKSAPPKKIEPSQLLSRSTSAAVDSAFNTLAQTVLVQNARTLEDLVREML